MRRRGGPSIFDWMLAGSWVVVIALGTGVAIQPDATPLSVGLATGAAALACVIAMYAANRLRGPLGDPGMPTNGPLWVMSVLVSVTLFVGLQEVLAGPGAQGAPIGLVISLVVYMGAFLWTNLLACALESLTGRRVEAGADRS